jgi:hypothetical protein
LDSYTAAAATLSWRPAVETGITSYIVAYGSAADPLLHRLVVAQPRVTLPSIAAGSVVSVKAVNARGLEGWDWARVTLGTPSSINVSSRCFGRATSGSVTTVCTTAAAPSF